MGTSSITTLSACLVATPEQEYDFPARSVVPLGGFDILLAVVDPDCLQHQASSSSRRTYAPRRRRPQGRLGATHEQARRRVLQRPSPQFGVRTPSDLALPLARPQASRTRGLARPGLAQAVVALSLSLNLRHLEALNNYLY